MNPNYIVVADGLRARFFTLQETPFPEMESGPNLTEVCDLVNPDREQDMWSEKKSGRNRSRASGAAHGYDDHRSQHETEYVRRFARSIAEEAMRLTNGHGANELVLVAQKRTLGHLRNELNGRIRSGVQIRELAKDLSKMSPLEIHAHLAREKLVPERRNPGGH
ncbi:MAG TPA: host attachment protein [Guyparkeria sp.]|nr:host attachment protein [Guyparkeria sp.]